MHFSLFDFWFFKGDSGGFSIGTVVTEKHVRSLLSFEIVGELHFDILWLRPFIR